MGILKTGGSYKDSVKYVDVYRERPIRLTVRVLVPVREHPKVSCLILWNGFMQRGGRVYTGCISDVLVRPIEQPNSWMNLVCQYYYRALCKTTWTDDKELQLVYGGLVFGLSQILLLSQLPQKWSKVSQK